MYIDGWMRKKKKKASFLLSIQPTDFKMFIDYAVWSGTCA